MTTIRRKTHSPEKPSSRCSPTPRWRRSVWPRMHRVSSRATSTSTSLSPPRVCSRCRRRGELRRVTPIRGASYRRRPGRRSSGRCDLKVGLPPDRVSCMQLVTSRTRLVHRFAAASSMPSERLPQQSGVSGRTASAPRGTSVVPRGQGVDDVGARMALTVDNAVRGEADTLADGIGASRPEGADVLLNAAFPGLCAFA